MSRTTRVLVTGSSGQVGVDVVDVLGGVLPPGGDGAFCPDGRDVREGEFEVLALTRQELDVTDRDHVSAALRATRPDVVVNLAAYTAVDRAESDAPSCYAANAEAVGYLSEAAHDVGAHLITISTDYVFDGARGRYVEGDETAPLNVYGASKRAGELLCREGDTVVRTSWVMGVRGRSVIHAMASRATAGESVRFVDDQCGTVTSAADLARSLVSFVRDRPGGYWHVANEGATTWFAIAQFVGTHYGRDDDFATAIATGDLVPTPAARRPARSDLVCEKFAAAFAPMPPWRDALSRLLRDRSVVAAT